MLCDYTVKPHVVHNLPYIGDEYYWRYLPTLNGPARIPYLTTIEYVWEDLGGQIQLHS